VGAGGESTLSCPKGGWPKGKKKRISTKKNFNPPPHPPGPPGLFSFGRVGRAPPTRGGPPPGSFVFFLFLLGIFFLLKRAFFFGKKGGNFFFFFFVFSKTPGQTEKTNNSTKKKKYRKKKTGAGGGDPLPGHGGNKNIRKQIGWSGEKTKKRESTPPLPTFFAFTRVCGAGKITTNIKTQPAPTPRRGGPRRFPNPPASRGVAEKVFLWFYFFGGGAHPAPRVLFG